MNVSIHFDMIIALVRPTKDIFGNMMYVKSFMNSLYFVLTTCKPWLHEDIFYSVFQICFRNSNAKRIYLFRFLMLTSWQTKGKFVFQIKTMFPLFGQYNSNFTHNKHDKNKLSHLINYI